MAHHQHEPGRADPSAAHALYPAAAFVHSVPFSPDGRVVISGSGDKIIRIWNSAHADKARAGVDTDGPRGADEDDPYPESDTPSIRASAFSNDPSIKKRKKKKKRKNGRGALADAEDEDDLPPVPISALTPEPEPASRFASMSPPPWPQPVRLLRTMEREFSEMDMTAADQLLLVVSKNPLWGDVPGHRIGEDEKFGQSRHKPSRIYVRGVFSPFQAYAFR
jgi:WD40 repeat protein